jgi:hypothetical protein
MKKYYLELISFEKKHRKELQKKYPTAKTMTATHPRDGGEFPYDCFVVMVAWESKVRPPKGIEMHNVCNIFYDHKDRFDKLFKSWGDPKASRFELACNSLSQIMKAWDNLSEEQIKHLQTLSRIKKQSNLN